MNTLEMRNATSSILYESLDYMYCDICRLGLRNKDDGIFSGCKGCHRKYNGWGISRKESDRLAKKIMELNK